MVGDNVDEAVSLLSSTIVDVQKLEAKLVESSISLPWCAEAATLLRKVHCQFLTFVEKCMALESGTKVPICLEEYMKETLNVLDICNLLKPAISKMKRRCLMVDVASRHLHDDIKSCSIAAIENVFGRLECDSNRFYVTENWPTLKSAVKGLPNLKRKDSTVRAIYAFISTFRIILFLILCAIFYPNSMKADCEEANHPQLKQFSSSLRRLVGCFCRKMEANRDGSRPVLVENKVMEKVISEIKAEAVKGNVSGKDKLRKSGELLNRSSLGLKEGLGMFESVVNRLFDEVVRGRNCVMSKISLA